MTTRALGLTLALVASCATACEPVPDLEFVSADAQSDAPRDAGGDTSAGDGGTDSGPPQVCSTPAPAGGTCCGAIWCLDLCGADNCAECASKGCKADEVCCGKMGTVICKDKVRGCP